jgi:hypothetical protein
MLENINSKACIYSRYIQDVGERMLENINSKACIYSRYIQDVGEKMLENINSKACIYKTLVRICAVFLSAIRDDPSSSPRHRGRGYRIMYFVLSECTRQLYDV